MSTSAVTTRLNRFIDLAFGGSMAEAAKALSWPRTGLYNYRNGRQEPGKVFFKKLYDAGGNPSWIMSGDGEMFADNKAGRELRRKVMGFDDDQLTGTGGHPIGIMQDVDGYRAIAKTRHIPLFMVPASAGPPTPADSDYIEDWINVEHLFMPSADTMFCIRANGKSMCFDGIHTGDLLFCDRSIPVEDGRVIVVAVNGELCVKRLEQRGEVTWLMPENPDFKPIRVTKKMAYKPWAVVTCVYHSLL